jgi:hypothetical protein
MELPLEVVMLLIKVAEDLVDGKRSPQDRREDAIRVLEMLEPPKEMTDGS